MPVDQIELMPAPEIDGDGLLAPLPDQNPFEEIAYGGILYATDGEPAGTDDSETHNVNDRRIVRCLGNGPVRARGRTGRGVDLIAVSQYVARADGILEAAR